MTYFLNCALFNLVSLDSEKKEHANLGKSKNSSRQQKSKSGMTWQHGMFLFDRKEVVHKLSVDVNNSTAENEV